ncbi:ReoY family proteolytic degradation factor [Virgibacillus soli]|uniref:UPF0302 protein RWD45_06735 n=1 Tax=Paracerasibacillus soli TaxID=480284 RepID=A0ABU5CR84_9BACI|nr:ReoY family proteolytic degradation factor [Virgibacillus soli]MDY0408312.1 ReoY family proteolytic degradation factor [Virgibacillus soli]
MQAPISVKDKKSFIVWFLNHYQLKKRESVWILNYIVNHEDILKNTHFVSDAKFCPRSIVMSSYCSDQIPFRFYKNHVVTTDAEKSFHDIRMNRHKELYIQLNFKNAHQTPNYVSVLEDNPFIPDEYFITKKDKEIAQQLLDKVLYESKRDMLKRAIDQALDQNDRHAFEQLTVEMQQLEVNRKSQP